MSQTSPTVEESSDIAPQYPVDETPAPTPEESIPDETAPATPAETTDEVPGEGEHEQSQAEDEPTGVEKALKDTKAWATKVSQDNSALRQALEAAATNPPPALMSDPQVAARLDHVRQCLGDYEEMGPLLELLDTVIHGVGAYEREIAHHALVHTVLGEHPDALEIRGDADFHDWVDKQPPVIRHCLHHSPNPRDASWVLGVYKKERDERDTKQARHAAEIDRQRRMRHAASPSPQTGSAPAGPR